MKLAASLQTSLRTDHSRRLDSDRNGPPTDHLTGTLLRPFYPDEFEISALTRLPVPPSSHIVVRWHRNSVTYAVPRVSTPTTPVTAQRCSPHAQRGEAKLFTPGQKQDKTSAIKFRNWLVTALHPAVKYAVRSPDRPVELAGGASASQAPLLSLHQHGVDTQQG